MGFVANMVRRTMVRRLQEHAEEGDVDAQGTIGVGYAEGPDDCWQQDYAEAMYWLSLAVKNRDSFKATLTPEQKAVWWKQVEETLAKAKGHLTPEQIAAVEKRVAAWKPKPPAE